MGGFDPYFDHVSSLVAFDGVDQSTTVTDATGITWTPSGAFEIDTDVKVFAASGRFFGGRISTPYLKSLFDWYAGEFTIEARVRADSWASWSYSQGSPPSLKTPCLIGNASPSSDTNYWSFGPNADGKLAFYYYNGTANLAVSTASIPLGQFNHIEADFFDGKVHFIINGALSNSVAINVGALSSESFNLVMGMINNQAISGHVEEFRITFGRARNRDNFTVPSVPHGDTQPVINISITESLAADNFYCRQYGNDDGALLAEDILQAGSQQLPARSASAIYLAVVPVVGDMWTANTDVVLGQKIFPNDSIAAPYYYQCSVAGKTGSSPPTWPTSPAGAIVSDGTAQFVLVERFAQPVIHGPLTPMAA